MGHSGGGVAHSPWWQPIGVVATLVGVGVAIYYGQAALTPDDDSSGGPSTAAPSSVDGVDGIESTSTTAVNTTVEVFQPRVDPAAAVNPGQCVGQAEGSARRDARRCSDDDYIYDPCFVPEEYVDRFEEPAVVVCPPADPAGDVLYLSVPDASGSDAIDGSNTDGPPWRLELGGGAVCTAATGMGSFVGQDRINWICDDSHLLIGQVDRTTQPWTVLGGR